MKCGYAISDITPALGTYIQGYLRDRIADGVIDSLSMRTVAFRDESGTAVLICCDLLGLSKDTTDSIRDHISASFNIDRKNIFVSCTHSHTAPAVYGTLFPIDKNYVDGLKFIAAQNAANALNDLHECKFSAAVSELRGISFVRRYHMKDGTVKTNPGRHNPNIERPVCDPDYAVQLLKIEREGAGDIALINFQVHPDVIGGCKLSADYPGTVCRTLEGALPGTHAIYFNGSAGDLNHIDVNCPEWDKNGGLEHSLHMGRTIAGKVLEMYTKARPIGCSGIKSAEILSKIPLRKPDAEEIEKAKQIMQWYNNGEIEKITCNNNGAMNLTIEVYRARGTLSLAQSNDYHEVQLNAMSIGDAAFSGFAGEPFCEIGKQVKAAGGYPLHFILGQTNGMEAYFPTKDAFAGGYESQTSRFLPGVAEKIIEDSITILGEIK